MSTEADWIHLVTRVVEIVGTAIIVVGSFGAFGRFGADGIRTHRLSDARPRRTTR